MKTIHNFIILFILTCVSFACTKEEQSTTNQPPQQPSFDGTFKGKWNIQGCPSDWSYHQATYVVFSSNGSFMSMYPSSSISPTYKTWYEKNASEVTIGSVTCSIKKRSKEAVTLMYNQDTVILTKVSDEQCPNITSIEKDPKGTNSLLFKGNPEYITKSEIITNMEILSYYQDKGTCFFGTPLTNPTNYITFSRNGCPSISYKLELGIWKKQ